jgi:hypothetical protein
MRKLALILIIMGVLVLVVSSVYFFFFAFVELLSCLALFGPECYSSPEFQPIILSVFAGIALVAVGFVNRKDASGQDKMKGA